MDDCGRRYAELRQEISMRFDLVERTRDQRHEDNVRRLNAQDATLAKINGLLWTVALGVIAGCGTLIFALIHSGGHL